MRQITGSDLRKIRSVSGMTTVQMAQAAGVKTRKTYENWEKNVGFPNVNQFFLMVEACGMGIDDVMQLISLGHNDDKAAA